MLLESKADLKALNQCKQDVSICLAVQYILNFKLRENLYVGINGMCGNYKLLSAGYFRTVIEII